MKVKKNTKKVKKNTKKTAESKKTPPKGRKNKASQPQQDEYFDHYVECVNKVMDECESTDCGAFEGKVPADFQISCYWTRHAVGAKVSKDRLETASTSKKNKNASKAKGKKKYKSKNYSQEA